MTGWGRRLLLAGLAGVCVLGPAGASRVGPSFDCARATTRSERAICTSALLPALDRRVARAYGEARRVLGGEPGSWLEGRLRAAQLAWRRRRDRCGTGVACLEREMRARAEVLSFRAPAGGGPPSGHFSPQAAGGGAHLLRLGPAHALVRIVTFHPGDARWICDVEGEVTRERGRWVLRDPGGRALAELRTPGPGGLTVGALGAANSAFCGLNGFWTGEYRRVEAPAAR